MEATSLKKRGYSQTENDTTRVFFLPRNAETDTHVVFQSSIDLSRPNGNEQESEWLMTRNVGTW